MRGTQLNKIRIMGNQEWRPVLNILASAASYAIVIARKGKPNWTGSKKGKLWKSWRCMRKEPDLEEEREVEQKLKWIWKRKSSTQTYETDSADVALKPTGRTPQTLRGDHVTCRTLGYDGGLRRPRGSSAFPRWPKSRSGRRGNVSARVHIRKAPDFGPKIEWLHVRWAAGRDRPPLSTALREWVMRRPH